jgi:hypothetical protein
LKRSIRESPESLVSHELLRRTGDLWKLAPDFAIQIQSDKRDLLFFCQSHKFAVVSGTRGICYQNSERCAKKQLSGQEVRLGRVDYFTRDAEPNQVLPNPTCERVSKF